MNILLLTHQRELSKTTNTGTLVIDVLGDKAKLIIWDRVTPNTNLMKIIDEGSIALLYPTDESELVSHAPDYQNYIIIDSTWQEARKIYNRSPYLKSIPSVKIRTDKHSAYHLRRNQKANGLCTAECAIEILKAKGFSKQADNLSTAFFHRIDSHSLEAGKLNQERK